MSPRAGHAPDRDALAFLSGGGDMGDRTHGFDWSKTPLGPVTEWPQSLKTAVRVMLSSRYPMFVWWGPQLVNLYNDAYVPILGKRHPAALGRPAREVWSEIWSTVGPLAETVLEGRATWNEELLLVMERNQFLEETYFTFSYSPIPDDDGGVGGVFCACTEDTQRVLGQRRLRILRVLAEQTAQTKTAEAACEVAAATLADDPHDLPFALLYLLDGDGRKARLAGRTALPRDGPSSPAIVELEDAASPWPFGRVAETGASVEVEELTAAFGPMPGGPWPEPAQRAVVLPMAKRGQTRLAGFVVAGVSPRLLLTDDYRAFLGLLAGQVATAVANARAYEEEKRRAEALAELDRAKTAFFSNVSHEFRTPLTLMLAPVEELLASGPADLSAAAREQLEVTHRNALRLLRLVNNLLDFSRIEAGRVRALYEPTDLPSFTADLASVFRAACERAGLRLVVDCAPLAEPVFVDREMWEKVVLNLLSNAFKFTFEGEIAVTLRQVGTAVELCVRDTGTGIPSAEMPRLFERFHRIAKARGRTHEGSGIGLALVQELVRLHGGGVTAESVEGSGTTFRVRMPLGAAHLPPDQIGGPRTLASTATGAGAYVEDALRWLPDAARDGGGGGPEVPAYAEPPSTRPRPAERGPANAAPRVLVADDNADMRQYLVRLLADSYRVQAVPDGEAALAAARERPPDLILADVMMPRLDGFGLLRALRGDPLTRALPVVLLSARAGEESRVEGMEAGADDYLSKPFGARELLARVSGHLQMARLRRESYEAIRESEERFRHMADHAPVMVRVTDPDGACTYLSRSWYEFTGQTPETGLGFGWLDAPHPDDRDAAREALFAANARREGFQLDYRLRRRDGEYRWAIDTAAPRFGLDGRFLGFIGSVIDITERKRAEEKLRESQTHLRLTTEAARVGTWQWNVKNGEVLWSRIHKELWGYDPTPEPLPYEDWASRLDPDDRKRAEEAIELCLRGGGGYDVEYRMTPRGHTEPRWIRSTGRADYDEAGGAVSMSGVSFDVTERKQAEEALKEADRRKDEFLATLAHELRNPLAPLRNGLELMKLAGDDAEVVAQARGMMERQLGQMVRLIDDLLDVSRISRGKVELRKERVELATVVQRAVETARPALEQAGHDLTLRVPPEPIPVDADVTRLAQVLANLLDNATKFTPQGGRIWLTLEPGDGEATVSVRDSGIGIPAEMRTRIFEMFTQAPPSPGRPPEGLGIGLSLVKRLVEMHGGSVEVRSEGAGRGSEFVVRLPVAASPVAVPEVDHAEESRRAHRRRILVVDDNRDAAQSLATMLRMMGNETQTAHDGLDALDVASAFLPDVILLDLGMPRLDGYNAARRIREQPWGGSVVLVALTGWGNREDRQRSQEAGFDFHLVKPAEPAALERLLAALPTPTA